MPGTVLFGGILSPKEKAMRIRLGVRLAFISLFTVVLTWGALAASEDKIPHFAFIMQQTATVKMKCEAGCAWKELSYSCGDKVPCCARVDERGVRGVPCTTEGE